MRKIILLGLCAFFVSAFSGQVLAGKVVVCEEAKDELKSKQLYGLCNAYWKAGNDNARAKILANFEKKAGPGGPGMPGLEPEEFCPCWDEAYLAAITEELSGVFCIIDLEGTGYDFALLTGTNDRTLNLAAGFLPTDPFNGTGCVIGASGIDLGDRVESSIPEPTDSFEDAECNRLLLEFMLRTDFSFSCY